MRFEKRKVWITGASSGIGRALALEFAREGADLLLCARRAERLEELAAALRSLGRQAFPHPCDVTREGDPEGAVQAALLQWGRLDVAVANAGFGVIGRVEDLALEDFRRQFETNVFGLLRTAMAALPELRKARGRLALLGSVSGYVSVPGASAYSMSKFAVRALAEALYFEMKPHGVAVTLISPGFVESEIRQVDNQGRRHPEAPDPMPSWIVMPARRAARKIVRAVALRRREIVLTGHGKLAVFLRHGAPGILRLAIRTGLRGRQEAG